MSRKYFGWALAVCLLATAKYAGADDNDDDDHQRSCIASHIQDCADDCRTARCMSKCEKEARAQCKVNVVATQHVFDGAVTSTAVNDPQVCSAAPPEVTCRRRVTDLFADGSTIAASGASCSVVTGTVANRAYFGGGVTMYVICPTQGQFAASTTVIGSTCSDPNNGRFTIVATNQCAGQTGCYGLIAVTPVGENNSCGGDAPLAPPNGDPGWATCTSGACPDI